ncbi:putative ATP-dependent endonuclease of the OLD family [Devosia enhydra]|uniref:Putative ATP-dependent endonuclease of the OLD family n=1 Tax=Devosia enhydra TaxID=665118 RepID=A0A1K2HUI4_9HYPH|nr:AAA family ATPase [Devosia enhydra]SFZ81751.1 putative ATP-dependent endonuclease of the OLD family [Devosia enhydra]
MRVRRLNITNFRGISQGSVDFVGHTLLVGGNNIGKSTVCEALDLVLGPERLFRRPVVDEHDFHCGKYLDDKGAPIEIRIEAVLIELSDEARRRFGGHLRRWNDKDGVFLDEDADALDQADGADAIWALPLLFVGRYDREEDDFIGNTFFDHPTKEVDALYEETEIQLGQGRALFTRAHKRLCGFVFLRTLRTGSRALSLQRGSLLDSVLKLGGAGAVEMWQDTLSRLQGLDPAIGEIAQLKHIRDEVRSRMGRFVNLAPGDDSTGFFASDLTREHLREVVRLFIAAQPGQHLVPFGRLGTGSINLLVFALLTFIAELKDKQSVIFAMEEPEIALPPHTQRRVTRFVLAEMGQSIVTSHSPYVIEQFDPEQIVILNRDENGSLNGRPIDAAAVKPKTFRAERRQFAEAILSRAVLVVEGSTEASLFPIASSITEASLGSDAYTHFDLAGVSIFNAGGDGAVPRHGPVFSALGKLSFGFYDKPNAALAADATEKLKGYTQFWESPEKGIENVLLKQMPVAVVRRFLEEVKSRSDYPPVGAYDPAAGDADVLTLASKVLKARKGDAYGYAAMLIAQCQDANELPATVREILETIHKALSAVPEDIAVPPPPPDDFADLLG